VVTLRLEDTHTLLCCLFCAGSCCHHHPPFWCGWISSGRGYTAVGGHTHSLMLLVFCRLLLPSSPLILVWLDKLRSWLHCGRRTHTNTLLCRIFFAGSRCHHHPPFRYSSLLWLPVRELAGSFWRKWRCRPACAHGLDVGCKRPMLQARPLHWTGAIDEEVCQTGGCYVESCRTLPSPLHSTLIENISCVFVLRDRLSL